MGKKETPKKSWMGMTGHTHQDDKKWIRGVHSFWSAELRRNGPFGARGRKAMENLERLVPALKHHGIPDTSLLAKYRIPNPEKLDPAAREAEKKKRLEKKASVSVQLSGNRGTTSKKAKKPMTNKNEEINEGFGAILHNYYGGAAIGVSAWRSPSTEDMSEYFTGYPDEELVNIVGQELADKIISFRRGEPVHEEVEEGKRLHFVQKIWRMSTKPTSRKRRYRYRGRKYKY